MLVHHRISGEDGEKYEHGSTDAVVVAGVVTADTYIYVSTSRRRAHVLSVCNCTYKLYSVHFDESITITIITVISGDRDRIEFRAEAAARWRRVTAAVAAGAHVHGGTI